jgi:hypothetical protein
MSDDAGRRVRKTFEPPPWRQRGGSQYWRQHGRTTLLSDKTMKA